MKQSINIIIPCFNEEKNIEPLFKKIEQLLTKFSELKMYKLKITLIENGSTDKTKYEIRSVFRKFKYKSQVNIKYINENRGYGYGIISGLKSSNDDIVGWTHSDLQTDLLDIINCARYLSPKKKILIMGKRLKRNFISEFISKSMSVIVFIFTQKYFKDINAQPKIFCSSLKNEIVKGYPYDFCLDLHLLLEAEKKKFQIQSLDVEFKDRISSKAKGAGSFKGILLVTLGVLKYLIRRIITK